jgi:HEAT repeat protein
MSWLLPPLPPTFEAALRDVRARKPEARIAAADRLATPEPGSGPQALQSLLLLADDIDARVRAAATRALRELCDERALDCLLERLDDPDSLVRELAVVALGALQGSRALAALRRSLRSPHPEVRFQAAASFAERCEPSDATALLSLLDDPDPKVRANAARSLARFETASRNALRAALTDSDADVRSEAALVLARAGDGSGADALCAALNNPELAAEALDAIAALGLHASCDAVAAIAESVLKPLALKVAAARALIRLGDARGVPALRQVLRAFRSDGRSYAVQVAGELRVRELTSELVRFTRRLRGVDPEVLVEALGNLLPGDATARAGLERLAKRADSVGERARSALARPE